MCKCAHSTEEVHTLAKVIAPDVSKNTNTYFPACEKSCRDNPQCQSFSYIDKADYSGSTNQCLLSVDGTCQLTPDASNSYPWQTFKLNRFGRTAKSFSVRKSDGRCLCKDYSWNECTTDNKVETASGEDSYDIVPDVKLPVLHRHCEDCDDDFKDLYYVRRTPFSEFHDADILMNKWQETMTNVLHKDYEIYKDRYTAEEAAEKVMKALPTKKLAHNTFWPLLDGYPLNYYKIGSRFRLPWIADV